MPLIGSMEQTVQEFSNKQAKQIGRYPVSCGQQSVESRIPGVVILTTNHDTIL